MRGMFHKQLELLHTELIRMGALCEEAIASAVSGLLDDDAALREKAAQIEKEIDIAERDIEAICLRLVLREQPVAGDLRQITAAQRMITDLERVGDQARDIAELSEGFSRGVVAKSGTHIEDMAKAAAQMVTACVESFVESDLEKAKEVILSDDVVDGFFFKIKEELIEMIARDSRTGGACLDILMIAKYLERIGDHAVNIAEWVVYSITGSRGLPR